LIFILMAISSTMFYFDAKVAVISLIGTIALDWMFDELPPSQIN
jgi:hypothetical protein